MRNLMVTMFVSLDGVLQAPGGPEDQWGNPFEHSGWGVPYFDEALIQRMHDLTSRADALLLGRRTYEIFSSTWPLAGAGDPIGAKLNGMRKYVASRTLDSVSWQNSTLLTGDVPQAVAKLKQEEGGEIQVHGSGGLIQTLLAHDLVDEFHVVVFPVLVGSGQRLFAEGTAPAALKLVDATTTDTGVVICRYERAGTLQYGEMGPETGNW
ncbi:dihydrofolate reductase family protein [Actinomadura rudentiformis]|uniref:Dihydrofolate reductase family protein n=1 Tax=Actinomadura rudentiformis TaxID=359158 RepID=A0A6H9ZD89_9ACTN|nr:dihydrofolate reductase family protein [Actinomadura rudentiformis]KAB2352509.1 dihydrofolate reductase family protein [Actinomadura rudentiformis]